MSRPQQGGRDVEAAPLLHFDLACKPGVGLASSVVVAVSHSGCVADGTVSERCLYLVVRAGAAFRFGCVASPRGLGVRMSMEGKTCCQISSQTWPHQRKNWTML